MSFETGMKLLLEVKEPSFVRLWAGSLAGGVFGGVLVGVVEVVLILFTSAQPEEYWLVPYAVVAYGFLGLFAGLGGAGMAALVARRRPSAVSGIALGTGLSVAALAVIVGRYHVIQRVFHEELVSGSVTGITVHLGVVTAGVVAAWMAVQISRALGGTWGLKGLLALLIAVLAGSTLLAAATQPDRLSYARSRKASAQGPSVVLIIADTLRADVLSSYGGKADLTPALSAFARDGVQFDRAHVESSWTRPSIATLLTSLYPSQHGAIHKMDPLPNRVETLAETFAEAGYWTAGIVSNINVAPIFNFQQGFGEYHYLAPAFYFWATDSATRLAIYKGLRLARERVGASRKYFYNYYQDAEVVGEAVRGWLAERPPEPFFLLIHYMDPHDPFFAIPYNGHGIARASLPVPPVKLRAEMYELYLQNVGYLDWHLGRVFDLLRNAGLYDETVIALVADHGEEFHEHGGWWHGTSLYEEVVRVPLIVKRAHEPTAGTRRQDLVRTIDLAPTLVAAAGLPVPAAFEGRELFGGGVLDEPLFAEEDLEGNVLASIRVGDWKLITANPGNPRGLAALELYDLASDPGEIDNRASREAQRVTALLEELRRKQAHLGADVRSHVGAGGYVADRGS